MNPPQIKKPQRKRVRLTAKARSRLILEAALQEFSQRGFAGARIEDIACRAGLSKTGVYGHYENKKAIFEAMLAHVLLTSGSDSPFRWDTESYASLEALVDAYLDQLYRKVQEPAFIEAFRLLLTEGMRSPEWLSGWFKHIVLLGEHEDQHLLEEGIRHKKIRPSPLTELFSMVAAPSVMWLLTRALLNDDPDMPLSKVRDMHRFMLLELLKPQDEVSDAVASFNQLMRYTPETRS